jgi:hypothetical protein
VVSVSLLWYPLAAMAGGVLGTIAHEALHALAAIALGELEGIGWQGGLAGGPFVDFRADSRWRSEVIRKLPLATGVGAAIAVVGSFDGLTLPWLTAAGAVAGLLWTSPEDLFRASAAESPAQN